MKKVLGVLILVAALHPAAANDIIVTNVGYGSGAPAGAVDVKFDLSWENSWRLSWPETTNTWTNWDAAWVFIKFHEQNITFWEHATLSTNVADHTIPGGMEIEIGLTDSEGVGVFLYRAVETNGMFSNTAIRLRWLYEGDGVESTSQVDVSVQAIEMVYIPEGSFDLGGVGSENGRYFMASNTALTYRITSEAAVTMSSSNGLWGSSGASGNAGVAPVDPTNIPAAYPKGYAAIYCMKHEISQGQYADFLNKLTPAQISNRFPNYNGLVRHTISNSPSGYIATRPARACNNLSWADVAAYLDWAGLRPMTELEYEKTCRGDALTVANEYAWGLNTIMGTTPYLSGTEDGTETVITDTSLGACRWANTSVSGGDGGSGPLRCGIFATVASERADAGGTYWGVLEMSGNVAERAISTGRSGGLAFTGEHGDGTLDSGGQADVPGWPGTSASGAGFRGGGYPDAGYLRTADRTHAAYSHSARNPSYGGRGVRTAP